MIVLEDTFTRKTIKDMMNLYCRSRKILSVIRIFLGIYSLILLLDEARRLSLFFSVQDMLLLIISIAGFWFAISGYKYWGYLFFHGGIYYRMKKDASLIVRYTIDNEEIIREIPALNKKYVLSWEQISRVESNEFCYYFVFKPFSRYFIIRKECFTETAVTALDELIKNIFNNTSFS